MNLILASQAVTIRWYYWCITVGFYNVGLMKTASLSDVNPASKYDARLAVDGIMNPILSHGSCFQTTANKMNYWQVWLESLTNITDFVITNRMDCCCKYSILHHYMQHFASTKQKQSQRFQTTLWVCNTNISLIKKCKLFFTKEMIFLRIHSFLRISPFLKNC